MGEMKVDSREGLQPKRYRWLEGASAFYIRDTETGKTACMGDGVDMFGDGDDIFLVGTQDFYDALNTWVDTDQATIAEAYFQRRKE